MKPILLILIHSLALIFQDGSDIQYVDPEDLNENHIGRYCHIDFGNKSFGGMAIDTIEINVLGNPVKFFEHRTDNGYTNIYSQQYLIKDSKNKASFTKLTESRIDSISADRVYVTSILSYYIMEHPIDTITVFNHSYKKSDIAQVLFKEIKQ